MASSLHNFLGKPQVSTIPRSAMRRQLTLLVTVFVLLAITNTRGAKTSPQNSLLFNNGVNGDRFLRVVEPVLEPEERGMLSSTKSALVKFKNWLKTTYWARSGKSDDYVMDALGFKGMTEQAMKKNPKYDVYKQYLSKLKGKELDEKLKNKVEPHSLWEEMKLTNADLAADIDAFKTYVRYATKYDHRVYMKKLKPENVIDNTETELNAKVMIWASFERPSPYVKEVLGLKGLSGKDLTDAQGYKYYQDFLRGTSRVE